MTSLSNRVREARKKAGLTQEDLAKKSSVTRNYIAQLEMGRKKPGIKTLDFIAKATGSDLIELLKGNEYLEKVLEIASKNEIELLRKELLSLVSDM